jgi:hypothetical protein
LTSKVVGVFVRFRASTSMLVSPEIVDFASHWRNAVKTQAHECVYAFIEPEIVPVLATDVISEPRGVSS